ncbi:MAG: BON domain-containing protein [Acidobacteria bacterium]|nr:BON domain-containing protein [Acidobacteriota bacterium]MBV9145425.1 BON domain-containing protein [Acidobacteriota bacterium]MBV9438009.1 BON domain-containing protein [Acidobacteriota bacterium]
MKAKSTGAVLTLTLLLAIAALSGCSKSADVAKQPTDAQIAGDVQTKISSDPQLSGKQISINANQGVVTLSGTVDSDAEVTSALNDAQQAQGVKQVVSKLAVQQAAAAPAAEAAPEPAPRKSSSSRASSSRARSRHSLPDSSSSYANSQGTGTTTASNSGSDFGSNGAGSSTTTAQNTYAPPPPPPPPQKVTIPAGTVLQVRTVEGLSSETNHEGDTWHGTLNSDITVDDQTVIPAGADVSGHVMEAHAATHYSGGASLVLGVDRVAFNGKTYQIATDTWERKADTRGKNTVEKTAGGAAVGAILGGIFGGGKGAAIGSVAGAGAGAGANTVTKGQRVELRPETLVSFKLENPISVMPSASADRHGTVIRPDNSQDQ